MSAALLCLTLVTGPLQNASAALNALEPKRALAILQSQQGPYRYEDHVRRYELLGITYAYLGQPDKARNAFETLLALEPDHVISYTLGPKVTFLFEEVRREARKHRPPTLQLDWKRGLEVGDRIPITVEKSADPMGFLAKGVLYTRIRGEHEYSLTELPLPSVGKYRSVDLDPVAAHKQRDVVLQFYVVARDAKQNEVMRLASPEQPYEMSLTYHPPTPWYRRWWAWTVAGTLVAAGAGVTAWSLSRSPPERVDGRLVWP